MRVMRRYSFGDQDTSYIQMLKWRLYLLLLRLRLWWGDLMVEFYYRRYLKMDGSFHAPALCVCWKSLFSLSVGASLRQ